MGSLSARVGLQYQQMVASNGTNTLVVSLSGPSPGKYLATSRSPGPSNHLGFQIDPVATSSYTPILGIVVNLSSREVEGLRAGIWVKIVALTTAIAALILGRGTFNGVALVLVAVQVFHYPPLTIFSLQAANLLLIFRSSSLVSILRASCSCVRGNRGERPAAGRYYERPDLWNRSPW